MGIYAYFEFFLAETGLQLSKKNPIFAPISTEKPLVKQAVKQMTEMRDVYIVLTAIVLMVVLLIKDRMRPGLLLFSVVVLFVCTGVLTPAEALAGFSNKGMITVGLLFLVSEGIRRSDCLGHLMVRLFPDKQHATARRGYMAIMASIAPISAFLNNTPIVVIFTPHVKAWAKRVGLPLKKFLIPVSYAAILGGMCTLIGTSTNLVVHGLMLDAGFEGFTVFELGKVGGIIALTGSLYIVLFGNRLLPDDKTLGEQKSASHDGVHIVEAILAPRFPGIHKTYDEFDFRQHYGADIIQIRRRGISQPLDSSYEFREGDTLVLSADENFVPTWHDSSVFLFLSNDREYLPKAPRWKKYLSFLLLIVMITGATFGQAPFMKRLLPGIESDMFFWASVVTVIMAFCNIFPPKKYSKFISWDILITIASALAISRAMTQSGLADWVAGGLIGLSAESSPLVVLAVLYLVTNLITEFITNNAAAAFAFPIALSAATQLGVNPMPFFVAICMAASASFSSPIGYQTNMIVQGVGNYKFSDFVKIGLPLNLIAFVVTLVFVPLFWKF